MKIQMHLKIFECSIFNKLIVKCYESTLKVFTKLSNISRRHVSQFLISLQLDPVFVLLLDLPMVGAQSLAVVMLSLRAAEKVLASLTVKCLVFLFVHDFGPIMHSPYHFFLTLKSRIFFCMLKQLKVKFKQLYVK